MKRWSLILAIAIAALYLGSGCYPMLIAADRHQQLEVQGTAGSLQLGERFRVMSWNIAHGRGLGSHQALQGEQAIRGELLAVVKAIGDEDVSFTALQEIDAGSWWSGGFDHAAFIARQLTPAVGWVHGLQVDGHGLHYGTAVLSRLPINAGEAIGFPAGWSVPAKGATIARIDGGGGRLLTVVSLHLHFLAGERQERQADMLIEALAALPRPLIVCGDFNAEWNGVVARVADALGLHGWQPATAMATFPGNGRRLDWILCSPELQIERYELLAIDHSDHRPVLATIRWPVAGD